MKIVLTTTRHRDAALLFEKYISVAEINLQHRVYTGDISSWANTHRHRSREIPNYDVHGVLRNVIIASH